MITGFLYTLTALGLLAALLLSFISSGMETALYRVSRVRLRIRSDQGSVRAAAVLRVLDRLDTMVTTILVDNNIAAYAGTYFLTMQLVAWRVPHLEIVTTAVVTPLFFVFTESLPKVLAYGNAEAFSMALVRVFSVFRSVLHPIVWLLNKVSALFARVLGTQNGTNLSHSQRTLLMEHLSAGVAEKVLTQEQNYMAVRIMQLEGISAGDSMIPLRKLTLLPLGAKRARALAEMTRRRMPLALLVDSAGRPTSSIVTMAALTLNPGDPDDPVDPVAERLEKIRGGVAIPEVLNLFRKRHARHALVTQGSRITGLITTQSVLDRIAGITPEVPATPGSTRRYS